jgi:hypothetical protein
LSSSIIPAITNIQFFQQLAVLGAITQAEALAAVGHVATPTVLRRTIDEIEDPATRFATELYLVGTATFQRAHPAVDALGAVLCLTAEQMNEVFIAASDL